MFFQKVFIFAGWVGIMALGYLPAYLMLSRWRWPGVFFVVLLLLLPFPVALSIHLMHLTAQPIPFLYQCACLGCTGASFFFLAKRQGWTKAWS